MSVQWVLLPVFVLVGLTFALLFGMAASRTRGSKAGGGGNDQFGDCFSNQFELPVLFYVLIALALLIRLSKLQLIDRSSSRRMSQSAICDTNALGVEA